MSGTVGNKEAKSGAREARIKAWHDREDMTLDEMWGECEKRGYTDYLAETRETLMAYVQHHIEQENRVAPLLTSLEHARDADYFAFDITSYSNLPAEPIYGKNKLAEVLLI
jgi:hypothetical protein